MYTLTSLLLLVLGPSQILAVWPIPYSIKTGDSVLWLDSSIAVTYNGDSLMHLVAQSRKNSDQWVGTPVESAKNLPMSLTSQTIVSSAVSRIFDQILKKGLIPWKFHARNEEFEPATGASRSYIQNLAIKQKYLQHTLKPLAGEVDESYNLTISKNGFANIDAYTSFGVLHALQTFAQLFYSHSESGVYTALAPVSIVDQPTFKHRGLNLDVARNWFPVGDILHTIDICAWNKFNRLHIHMTDSQSWPMDIPALPLLSQKGAYQKKLTYSPGDIRQIHRYATLRGIEIIIEFDMPGHTTSIGYAYPDLIAAFKASPWDTYCAEPPCGSLQLNNSAVLRFLDKLFDDVLPRLKQYSAYFHTGGDEVNLNTYLLDPSVRSNDKKVLQPLIQRFVNRNHDQIRKAGLTPIVWEEMLLDWDLDLGKDVVVQSWLSDESVGAITKKGYKALAGNYNFWYLDCGAGQWLNMENGPSFEKHYPFNDYCSPVKNWRLIYSYDPYVGVAKEDRHLVLGGEVHMWAEQTDPENLEPMLWPRASAAGEVLWSGRQDINGINRSQVEASPRLAEWRERMVLRGVRAGPVQMIYCTQGDGKTCAL